MAAGGGVLVWPFNTTGRKEKAIEKTLVNANIFLIEVWGLRGTSTEYYQAKKRKGRFFFCLGAWARTLLRQGRLPTFCCQRNCQQKAVKEFVKIVAELA